MPGTAGLELEDEYSAGGGRLGIWTRPSIFVAVWYEITVGRNHDKIEFWLAHWCGARPPAEVNKLIFFIEVEVAGTRFGDDFGSR